MCFVLWRHNSTTKTLRLTKIFLFFLSALVVNFSLAHADEPSRSQQIAKTCWDISEAKRDSPVTPDMREGMTITATCLEESILKIASEEFFKDSPDKLEKFKADFKAFSEGAKSMTWSLHNEADWCAEGCGTMGYIMAPGAYANMLEDFLEEMMAATIEGGQPEE